MAKCSHFFQRCLDLLALFFLYSLLLPNQGFGASTLPGDVLLERGFVNQYEYSRSTGYWSEPIGGFTECAGKYIEVYAAELDMVTESRTYVDIRSAGSYEQCSTRKETFNYKFWDGTKTYCELCTDSSTYESGLQCLHGETNQITFTVGSIVGSGRSECSQLWLCEEAYASCNTTPPFPAKESYATSQSDSLYTFRLECPDNKSLKSLEISADGWIQRDGEKSPGVLLINGISPINTSGNHYEWTIPIDLKCGDSVTLVPSISSGMATAYVSSINAIFCVLDIADFTASAATISPSAGESVDMTASITSDEAVNWTLTLADKSFSGSGDVVSATWDGKDANGETVPNGTYAAALSAETVGGGCKVTKDLTITVESNTCDINITPSPSEVWPMLPKLQRPAGYNADSDTTSTVMVSLTNPAPPEGCTVDLSVEPTDNSGGHNHTGSRPKSTLSKTTVFFSGGQSGAQNVTYTSSEVSGKEKVIAKVKSKKKGEAAITVRVPGLQPLESSIAYNLSQSPPAALTHPSNHYGLPSTNAAVDYFTFDYTYETDAILGINDMSLEKGGLFDYEGTWARPHNSHRKGTSVDIDRMAQDTQTRGYVRVDVSRLTEIVKGYKGKKIPEATIHYEFSFK
ncbi:MAG: hypothetical protein M0Z71_05350 [Nitrospiraceae bacterium]|nr:hypothetical protein [Nitrospiraceae bacterium]